MCAQKVDLLSVTFDPETAEIRWSIVTHPIGGHYVATVIIIATCLVNYICGHHTVALSVNPVKRSVLRCSSCLPLL